jgi:hypothetical protein
MNHKPWLGAVLVCGALIAGCDVMNGDTNMMNGAIVLKDRQVILSPVNQPKAAIDSNGNLTIDDKAVSVTPAQQALLMAYYMNVVDIHNIGIKMAKAGSKVAVQALAHAASASKEDKAQGAAQELANMSLDICKDTAGIKTVQDQLGAQLPAFKPYANIVSSASVDSCVNEAKDDSKDAASKDAAKS